MKAQRWRLPLLLIILSSLWGCGAGRVNENHLAATMNHPTAAEVQSYYSISERTNRGQDFADSYSYGEPEIDPSGWTYRVVAEKELLDLNKEDPELSFSISKQILARLNVRAPYYIDEDIRNGRPLKVPNDFRAYKSWTPLPRVIPEVSSVPKFILIVKDIPFLGWYEEGRLAGDSHICIGKKGGWTRAGIYRVRDKDIDHVSRSYTNAYGQPAPMPWALRIYEHVWIHAGDITKGNCSHGCINLPLMPAQQLYGWADFETVVLVVESLPEMQTVFDNNRSNCVLFARECRRNQLSVIRPLQREGKLKPGSMAAGPWSSDESA
ncbi:MAG: L,D-transpeptidase [Desulforhabdus sp.]|jgi:hypothetical protein|nr:L,D-transpeptidase [Desulforhabdus sp.]